MQKNNYETIPNYRCNVCKAIFDDKGEVKKHSQIPADEPLPLGFAYCKQSGTSKTAYITINKGKVSQSKAEQLVHSYEHQLLIYDFNYDSCAFSCLYYGEGYSKRIRKDIKEGKAWLITDEELKIIKASRTAISWLQDSLCVRDTPSLEKLVFKGLHF